MQENTSFASVFLCFKDGHKKYISMKRYFLESMTRSTNLPQAIILLVLLVFVFFSHWITEIDY